MDFVRAPSIGHGRRQWPLLGARDAEALQGAAECPKKLPEAAGYALFICHRYLSGVTMIALPRAAQDWKTQA
jgi:hypothetical protein